MQTSPRFQDGSTIYQENLSDSREFSREALRTQIQYQMETFVQSAEPTASPVLTPATTCAAQSRDGHAQGAEQSEDDPGDPDPDPAPLPAPGQREELTPEMAELVRSFDSPDITLDAPEPPTGTQALPAIFEDDATIIEDADAAVSIPVPEVLLHPGGLLEEIQQYTLRSVVRTDPIFGTVAGICILGTLIGHKVQTETALVSNMYCVCVGASSSGKDAPRKTVQRLIKAVAPDYLGGTDLASDVGLRNHLAREGHQRAIFVLDEFGMLLRSCRQPGSPKAGLAKLMTELWSSPFDPSNKVYADFKNNKEIPWHCLNILGMSVPGEFYNSLHNGESTNGFLARLLVFEIDGRAGAKRYEVDREIPYQLKADLSALAQMRVGEVAEPRTINGETPIVYRPEPTICRMTPEAKAHHIAKDTEFDALLADYESRGKEAAASILGKAAEQAGKLALVFAASRAGAEIQKEKTITLEDVCAAWQVVEFCTKKLIASIEFSIAGSEFEAVCQAIKKKIVWVVRRSKSKPGKRGTNKPRPGAHLKELQQATPGVPIDILQKAIDKLIKANELRVWAGWKASAKSNFSFDLYCLAKDKDPDEML